MAAVAPSLPWEKKFRSPIANCWRAGGPPCQNGHAPAPPGPALLLPVLALDRERCQCRTIRYAGRTTASKSALCCQRAGGTTSGFCTMAAASAAALPRLVLLLGAAARGSSAGSAYSCAKGAGLAGGDLAQRQGITLAEAESWCLQNASCAAFTFASNATCAVESGNSSTAVLASVYFKRGISSNTDGSWSFYARSNFTPPFHPAPAYRGCDTPPGSLLPWCNRSASHDERLDSLVNELNLTEKIGLLSPTKALGNPWCGLTSRSLAPVQPSRLYFSCFCEADF